MSVNRTPKEREKEFVESLYHLSNRYAVLSKKLVDFGTGEKLTAAEIHSIAAIGNDEGLTLSALSSFLGITKGAASQMVSKLESRGYVSKSRQPDYWKEIMLHLTEKGKKAFRGHEAFHRKFDSDIIREIEKLSPRQIDGYLDIVRKIEDQVERYIDESE